MPAVSANTQLVALLAARGWVPASLRPLELYPLPIRSGARAQALLAGITAELAVAIDAALAQDGRALAASLERPDAELLCEAMVARHRAPTIVLARSTVPPPIAPLAALDTGGPRTLTLIVDSAERSGSRLWAQIVARLAAKGVRCERRPLAVGDYCWTLAPMESAGGCADDELMVSVIAERKTASDLAASVQDGRYHEQKYRLAKAQALGISKVGYIFEGTLRSKSRPGDEAGAAWRQQALPSALAKTAAHSRFSVMHTATLDGTVGLLADVHHMLAARLRAEAAAAVTAGGAPGGGSDGCSLLARDGSSGRPLRWAEFSARLAKRDDETRTAVWGKMLLQLPGVSAKIAEALRDAFPTAAALRAALRRAGGREAAAKAVAELRLRDSARRVGPIVAGRVVDAFAPGGGGWRNAAGVPQTVVSTDDSTDVRTQ